MALRTHLPRHKTFNPTLAWKPGTKANPAVNLVHVTAMAEPAATTANHAVMAKRLKKANKTAKGTTLRHSHRVMRRKLW
jgi:hypothetical protein